MSAPSEFKAVAADFAGDHFYRDLTILSGASLSDAADLYRYSAVAILMPATWTSAGLSFQGSVDGSTYGNLTDKTAEITIATLAGAEYVVLDPSVFFGVRFLKVRSGTAGSAVAQGGDRVLRLIGRRL